MFGKPFIFAELLVVMLAAGCATATQRGMALGTLGGGGVGGLIGGATGHRTEGTLIGAAIGGLTGAEIGSSIDEQKAQAAALQAQQTSGAVRPADVAAMVQSGVGEEVIATHIRANGVQHRIQAGDLIALRNQGVSDYLINTMQTAPVGGVMAGPQPMYAAPPGTVIVQEPVYAGPVYYGPPRRYWGPPPQPSFNFEFISRRR